MLDSEKCSRCGYIPHNISVSVCKDALCPQSVVVTELDDSAFASFFGEQALVKPEEPAKPEELQKTDYYATVPATLDVR